MQKEMGKAHDYGYNWDSSAVYNNQNYNTLL